MNQSLSSNYKAWLRFISCVGLVFLSCATLAQKTTISGRVFDAETNEGLPFVNLIFVESKIGTTTDLDGNFSISTYYATDSLRVSFIGYDPLALKVEKDEEQVLNFGLRTRSTELGEVVIKADKKAENPAHAIFRNIIRNKKINNREKLEAYQYEAYNKIEFDLNNIQDEFKERKVMRPFKVIFDYIDTSEAKPSLPMFMTESISDYYYRKNPKAYKELIKATKVSGIENESVNQFLGDMYQNINVYDNYINAFGLSFVSPVSDFGLLSYRYYLTDSALLEGHWCYKLTFLPKRETELTFSGDMWVHDTTYAVKQIEAEISTKSNINYIKAFKVKQEYNQVEDEVWMLTKDNLVIDFAVSNKTFGIYGRKSSTYENFVINQPKEQAFYKGVNNVIINDSASHRDDSYWEKNRHEELTETEQNIYAMVDTIKQIPAFRTIADLITVAVSGYYVMGLVELGPYFTTYSFNRIEGHRFRLGGRTSNDFSTRLMLEGYAAYGIRDRTFKYSAGFQYFLSKKPRQFIGGRYIFDIEQLGQSENAWRNDNIIASVFRQGPSNTLNGFELYNIYYEREWFTGFSNRVSFDHRELRGLGGLRFLDIASTNSSDNGDLITTAEVSLLTRFAFKEKYVEGQFSRVSLGSKYPILQVKFSLGIDGIYGSEYEYQKMRINIRDRVKFNPFGHTEWLLEGGKIWGTLPYPLLELHNGNETYAYNLDAFNLMNFYEFVSDQYISAAVTHHFNGLFLNKIPLIRKLKWREVISGKGVAGNLSNANLRELEIIPVEDGRPTLLSKPYFEGGIGIENILSIIRVDALWRLSHLDEPNVTKFGVRGTFQIKF